MNRSHVIRMYPTREQEVQLRKTAGTSRYAYNWAHAKWKEMYKAVVDGESTEKPSAFKLCSMWTQQRPEWSRETNRISQSRAILNVGQAFQNLWRGTGKYPTFHKKGRKESFYVDNTHVRWYGNKLSLPNIGRVLLAEPIRYSGQVMSYTVSTYAGQWYVAVQVDTPEDVRPACCNPQSVVGVDVGLHHIAVASDGTICDAPESLKRLERKLKDRQRALARSQRNSNNYNKRLLSKQKVQNRINNIRKDVTHKFTTTISKNHGVVVTEDLNIQGMVQKAEHHSMRRSLGHSMMGMILWQLSYKAQKHVKAVRFFPSTKMCSCCGHVRGEVPLSERTYVCPACGAVIDRDMNAAVNLMKSGVVSPGVPVELVVNHQR